MEKEYRLLWMSGEKSSTNCLKNHWDNANLLYNDVLKAIQNNFISDVEDAAMHLKEIDTIKERGYNTLAIIYLKIKSLIKLMNYY